MHERIRTLKQNLLFMEDVTKRYGAKCVLNAVDLSVEAGEFCSLVGPSGCGKSTLLRIILGQERPSSGIVTIGGEPVGLPDDRRGIVYQKYTLFPHLTVHGNVREGRALGMPYWRRWRDSAAIDDEVMSWLEQVRLADHRDKYPHELSGGMQQRVAIAQALIARPQILLMDEPFGALDASTREHMQVFLLELWEKHRMTVFFVTHDLTEAIYLGTRIIVLSQFYAGEDGLAAEAQGSKIVTDIPSPWGRQAVSTKVKAMPEFGELIAQIRREGFDPAHRQEIRAFNLKAGNSFPVEAGLART